MADVRGGVSRDGLDRGGAHAAPGLRGPVRPVGKALALSIAVGFAWLSFQAPALSEVEPSDNPPDSQSEPESESESSSEDSSEPSPSSVETLESSSDGGEEPTCSDYSPPPSPPWDWAPELSSSEEADGCRIGPTLVMLATIRTEAIAALALLLFVTFASFFASWRRGT
jgi:hypothetical protein